MSQREAIVLRPGEGRSYNMAGHTRAVFKADGGETAQQYSISEWWLQPHTKGPGAHSHPQDDVFYILEGTVSFLLGERWLEAPKGSFVLVPGTVIHDYENRTDAPAGMLNFWHPGTFEEEMPGIVQWYADNPQAPD